MAQARNSDIPWVVRAWEDYYGGPPIIEEQHYTTPQEHGPIGAGDDAPAIQAAIDSCLPYGGMVWLVPGTTYLIGSTLQLSSVANNAVRLVGGGIHPTASTGGPSIIIKASTLNGPAIVMGSRGSSCENFILSGQAGNGGYGIHVKANNCALRNVSVNNMGSDGIKIGGDTGQAALNCNSFCLDRIMSTQNAGHGLNIDDLGGFEVGSINANAGSVTHLVTQNNTGDGVHLGYGFVNTFINILNESDDGWGVNIVNSNSNTFHGSDFGETNGLGNVNIASGCYANVFISTLIRTLNDPDRLATILGAGIDYNSFLRLPAAGKISIGTVSFHAGLTAPNNTGGEDGDFYFRGNGSVSSNTLIYHKEGGNWISMGVSASELLIAPAFGSLTLTGQQPTLAIT